MKSPDIHHVGAVPQGTVTTKKECFKKCKKSADCKNGFEWNNSKKKCLFPKPGVAANTYKGTDYYACEGIEGINLLETYFVDFIEFQMIQTLKVQLKSRVMLCEL